jgi:hypothetical protein
MRRRVRLIGLVALVLLAGWYLYPQVWTAIDPAGRWAWLTKRAKAMEKSGRLHEADRCYSQALAVAGRLKNGDIRAAQTAIALGDLCRKEYRAEIYRVGADPAGPPPSPIESMRYGLDEFRRTIGEQQTYGKARWAHRYLPRAAESYREALAAYKAAYRETDSRLASGCTRLAWRFERLRCAGSVRECLCAVLKCQSARYGDTSPRLIPTLRRMIDVANHKAPVYEQIAQICTAAYGREDARTQDSLRELAAELDPLGAEPVFAEVLAASDRKHGKDSIDIVSDITDLARCYRREGRLHEAEQLDLRGIRIAERYFRRPYSQMREADPFFFNNARWRDVAFLLDNHLYVLKELGRKAEADALLVRLID